MVAKPKKPPKSGKQRSPKTPAPTPTPKPPSTANGHGNAIRIRMYRIGFGDCFLVTLMTSNGPQHILVDCGVHARGTIGDQLQMVVSDIASTTGKKLALIVMTHVHQDHISGFGTCADVFREFDVSAVWMPWTEDPNDAAARSIHGQRLALAEKLQARLEASPRAAAAKQGDILYRLQNLTGLDVTAGPGAAALKGNSVALDLLRCGFKKNIAVNYYGAGDQPKLPDELVGLSVQILGPPRSPEFLEQMNPPADEHYLRLATDGDSGDPPLKPFADSWRSDAAAYAQLYDTEDALAKLANDAERLRSELPDPSDALAAALDNAINNTSLVLLLRYQGKNLLFAGDAQWGNWKSWLYASDPDADGGTTSLSQTAKEVLGKIDFYKVAHHGSLNATPVSAVEGMPKGAFAAMCSTQSTPWQSIPRPQLMTALEQQCGDRLIRSDALAIPEAPAGAKMPSPLPAGFSTGSFWIDYSV